MSSEDKRRTPATVKGESPATSDRGAIEAFLERARAMGPQNAPGGNGRLMFALDATMSRQPTWDRACSIQAEMFEEAGKVGGLDVQLVYFRGFGECRASKWISDGRRLGDLMSRIDCRGGRTQIAKVLARAIAQTRETPIQALVYIGDAMEESVDLLCDRAGELGMLRVPIFLFQERRDPTAHAAFKEMARLSRGAHLTFDDAASGELAKLLNAVAVYAAGGRKALADRSAAGDGGARLLIEKLS